MTGRALPRQMPWHPSHVRGSLSGVKGTRFVVQVPAATAGARMQLLLTIALVWLLMGGAGAFLEDDLHQATFTAVALGPMTLLDYFLTQ